jgi:hypothetical protein
MQDFNANIDFYRERIVLRPQEISNHPELMRRLGLIAMNAHDRGRHLRQRQLHPHHGLSMMNGIGGSGDFARNAYLSIFMTPSVAKGGAISCIVPMSRTWTTPSTTCRSSSPNRAWPTCAACRPHSARTRKSSLKNAPTRTSAPLPAATILDRAREKRAELRRAALEYHEFPSPARSPSRPPSRWSTSTTWRWPTRPAWPRLRRNRQGPQRRLQVHQPRQPGGRGHQRHRRAGPGRHRPAGRQAGDGGQGRAVQEVLGHRCVRHRDQRERPGQAGRDHRRAGAHLRRHQPRRHQGARLLLRRAQAARAHEDPGLPRRPARHRHRGGRGHPQRPEGGGQGHQEGQAGHLGRRRRRAGLPGPAGQAGPAAREHLGDRPGRRGLRRPHRADGRGQGQFRAKDRAAHAGRGDRRRRRVPGPVGRRRAQARHGGQMARAR